MVSEPILYFDRFCLDPQTGRVWHNEQLVPLSPKACAVLRYLSLRAGQVVPQADVRQAVWPETGGSAAALKVCIREIRKALQDDTATPRFIETIPRRGYRFIAQVVSRQQSTANSRQQSSVLGPASRVPQATVDPTPNTSHPSPSPLHPPPSLVGREAELQCLQAALGRARRGERQIVFVTGEPGIGKTALVETFLAQLVALSPSPQPLPLNTPHPTPFLWIARGQCIEHYGAGEAYLPVLEALSRLGRETEGGVKATLAQYAPTWLAQLPALIGVTEREAVQRALVGATRERMLREMAEALEALSAQRPFTLVLEDLHWSDPSTVELLAYMARRQGPAQLLILGTYRPADLMASGHPLKGVVQELQGRGHCEQVRLKLLDEEHVNEYVSMRLGDERGQTLSLPDLAHLLYQRTEGNPLFMVTVVDQLLRGGSSRQDKEPWRVRRDVMALATDVPESLRQLIDRQCEGLQEEERRLLEVASVVGTEFAVAAVAVGLEQAVEVVEERCATLAARGSFVRAAGVEEWPDGTLAGRYRFLHAVYQNVLYDRVVEARRMRLHRRIGERKAAAYGKRSGEVAAELAAHFEAGRDYERAAYYLGKAGENALRRNAHQEAVTLVTKGLQLFETLPDTHQRGQQELHLLTILGSALVAIKGYGTSEVEKTYARAYKLCQQVGETAQLSPVLHGLRIFYYVRGDLPRARVLSEQLLRLAQQASHPFLLISAHVALGETLSTQGELTLARAHFEQVWALYDPQRHSPWVSRTWIDPGVVGFCLGAMVLWLLGYPDQAAEKEQTALRLAHELSHPFSLAYCLARTGVLRLHRGEVQGNREQAEALIALTRHHGFPFWLPHGMVQLGVALTEQGQEEAGIAQLREGLAGMRAVGNEVARSRPLAMLAQAYANIGHITEGLSLLAEALELADKGGERTWEAELHRLKGELSLQLRQVENKSKRSQGESKVKHLKSNVTSTRHLAPGTQFEAEECFVKALEVARQQQAKSLELRAAMSLARLWQQQGKRAATRQLLEEIYGWFTEGFDTKDLQEAEALLTALGGRVRKAGARKEKADVQQPSARGPRSAIAPHVAAGQQPSDPPAPQPPIPAPQIPEHLFRYEGEYWTLAFAGTLCRITDTRGMHYLAQLLRHPHQEFHPLTLVTGNSDLEVTDTAPGGEAPIPPTVESERPARHITIRDLLSPRARAVHKRRLAELRAELEEAQAFNDSGRREKLQNDIEVLTQQLARAAGLGSRARTAVSPAEQARVNVTRTIKTAIKRITESHPALGHHLATAIKTGNFCVYTPDPRVPIRWQVV